MKRIILCLNVLLFLLLLTPFVIKAQSISDQYKFEPRLYMVGKSLRDEQAFREGKSVSYIVAGKKPNIGTSEAISCNQEFCEFKFGILVTRYAAGKVVSMPLIISSVNGDKKHIQQNLKAESAKDSKEARLIIKVRLFFGETNTVNVGINYDNSVIEYDKTNNFYKFFFNLAKD